MSLADTVGERKQGLPMSISSKRHHDKYSDRPTPCPRCSAPAWWNGSRTVSLVRKLDSGVQYVQAVVRRRARCSSKGCPRGSWTLYEEEGYPHRLFSLDVVVSAVCTLLAGKTQEAAARTHACSRRSVQRWRRWVEHLADPCGLMRACTRLEPRGLPGAAAVEGIPRAVVVLHLLDRFTELLAERGVRLSGGGSGLARVLKDQLARLGVIFYLTKSSPPLLADVRAARL